MTAAERFETRGVLAGAYKGRSVSARALLTHLADTEADGEAAVCGRAPNLVDPCGMTPAQLQARPTCPPCARRWDALQADREEIRRAAASLEAREAAKLARDI